jgi:2-amino-4-hydroxy-6-hydroxymethyldihydropteridine diphosphokinase
MPRVGIALGSNLGDRLANLQRARAMLREIASPGSHMLAASIYQTEPLFCPSGSPLFYNSVVEISVDATARELLVQTQAIEKHLGRDGRHPRNAPRLADLDILYYGTEKLLDEALTLPHPRLHQRRFVLQPLAEIVPELLLPGFTQTISELLATLQSTEPPLVIVAAASPC